MFYAKQSSLNIINNIVHLGDGAQALDFLFGTGKYAGRDTMQLPKLILLDLKKRGLLYSKIGKGGGYQLAKSPDKIYLGEIIRILDGPLALTSCTSKACVVSGCDSTVSVIDEELEIKKGSTAPREAGEYGLPSGPDLIVMCELDVDVLEWNCADVSNYFQGLWSAE